MASKFAVGVASLGVVLGLLFNSGTQPASASPIAPASLTTSLQHSR
jgi:hypothetical protein